MHFSCVVNEARSIGSTTAKFCFAPPGRPVSPASCSVSLGLVESILYSILYKLVDSFQGPMLSRKRKITPDESERPTPKRVKSTGFLIRDILSPEILDSDK